MTHILFIERVILRAFFFDVNFTTFSILEVTHNNFTFNTCVIK